MADQNTTLPKSLILLAICIPLAIGVGYFLATPTDYLSFAAVGLIVSILCIPLLMRWHHPALILGWNANMTIFFLPGEPSLWMVFAAASLFITFMACLMDKKIHFHNVPSLTWPLLFLTGVVVITAKLTGGIGLRSLGSDTYGGKKLFFILAAVIGYFALSSQSIPSDKVHRYTRFFFLSGITSAVSNFIFLAGPSLYFLFLVFPTENAAAQAFEEFQTTSADVRFVRLTGITVAAMFAFYYLLARYGLRGLLDLKKPWRIAFALTCFGLSLLGGFRSAVIIFAILCVAQFYFERLYRTRFLLATVLSLIVGGALLATFATRMPLSMQRSLSFLPVEIDPLARISAEASTEWRLEMWKLLLPQVREHLLLGKGYSLDPTDLYLTDQSVRRGLAQGYEGAMVAGDYHSGPLSILIPFGVFGLIGLVWLMAASIRVLYRNHRFSDPSLQTINTFLLSFFVARAVYYFIGFGSFYSDLPIFLGIIGFSVSLNALRVPRAVHEPVSVPLPLARISPLTAS
jgi:hypothetical protein